MSWQLKHHLDAGGYLVVSFVLLDRGGGTALHGEHDDGSWQGECRSFIIMFNYYIIIYNYMITLICITK